MYLQYSLYPYYGRHENTKVFNTICLYNSYVYNILGKGYHVKKI